LGALIAAVPASAATHNLSISLEDDGAVQSCDQLKIRFGDSDDPLPVARAEQGFTLARGATPSLQIHLADSGGMSLSGWDRQEYGITACLAVGARDGDRAAGVLQQIGVALDRGRMSVRGPDGEDWLVYVIVRVPEGAALDLESINGPIGLREVSGRIKARAQNGPVSLSNCRGDVDVQVQNGPLSIQAGGGRQRLRVENGPLAIALEGRRWEGEGIDARAENGPVSLKFPDDYQSGVRLEMAEHSPLRCRSAGCRGWFGGDDDGLRRLDFGSSSPVIRVSAGNGPVDIKSAAPIRRSANI
jgi:hypothetical protein